MQIVMFRFSIKETQNNMRDRSGYNSGTREKKQEPKSSNSFFETIKSKGFAYVSYNQLTYLIEFETRANALT